ncbi:uncharacterized protein LOC123502000 isoform X3 [Portunus trituberculatus]|uniref:uncharacterized protein LOC123502000 isoform X3 n=1 Tax=Portunus trituberculatus TaxID=210409 RepID=UPI001E1D1360|nr:uncharacterized protein LOC123502000 isoform X3 [Portunus trituberculatus]
MENKKQERHIRKERSFTHMPRVLEMEEGSHHHNHHHHHNPRLSRSVSFYRSREQLRRRSAMPATNRSKPAMELYRPPTLRGPGLFDNGEAMYNGKVTQNGGYGDPRSSLNVNAKEFVSSGASNRPQTLQHSKSSSSVPFQGRQGGLQHSKSGSNLRQTAPQHSGYGAPPHDPPPASTSPPRVHFSDDKENDPDMKCGPHSRPPSLAVGAFTQLGIKRSKSLGSADLRASQLLESCTAMPDLGPFSPEVMNSITRATNDPNSVSARQLMEVVRHVFTRVVEASRHAEPAARLCISIIQKEKNETFLETLLNTCQEYFQERDRLLRNNPPAPYPGFVPAHPRWIAYMTFLNEMYTQLKRRHVQLMTKRMRNSETPPGLLLLTLLAQCCQVCLKENAVNSLAETECLFFVLTGVGKDIEVELPHQMGRVMTAARDAFLTTVRVPAVRKTLLQLIEMHAARWQLPAPAVMYYYPGSGSK